MYQWSMDPQMRIEVLNHLAIRSDAIGVYWIFVLFLAMCCASRLARFNTMLDEKLPTYWTHFFMGVPAPAGAFLAILPLIFWLASGETALFFKTPLCVGVFLLFSGALMASKIPTLCLKHIHLSNRYRTVLLLISLILIAGFVTIPWTVLSLMGVCYLISIPVGIFYFLKEKNARLSFKGGKS